MGNSIDDLIDTQQSNESANETDIFHDDLNCQLETCECLQRIRKILHFYQTIYYDMNNSDEYENEQLIIEYINNNEYKHLINDYQHILLRHLNNKNNEINATNYDIINKSMRIITCNLKNCILYQRNMRDRENKNSNSDYKQQKHDENASVFIDILDNLHTFFIHGYDTGFRLKMNHKNIDNGNDELIEEHEDVETLCNDAEITLIQKTLATKRNTMQSIDGFDRITNNKFSTNINDNDNDEQPIEQNILDLLLSNLRLDDDNKDFILWLNDNEYDSDAVMNDILFTDIESNIYHYFVSNNKLDNFNKVQQVIDIKNNTDNDSNNIPQFNFGISYYYWDYYKNNDSPVTEGDAVGYKFSDFYIIKKYNNLQEEILNELNKKQFMETWNKANKLLNESVTLKSMKSREDDDYLHYDIEEDTALSVDNLLSVLFYTDYSKLSYKFSAAFRKKSPSETLQGLKDRNSNYFNWSKLLHQTVNLYGNMLNEKSFDVFNQKPQISILYHGVSMMYFNSFVSKFFSPTSMTRQFSVATIFASGNGIILEIEQCQVTGDCNPFYFNCSLLSCYSSEDERLFVGGTGYEQSAFFGCNGGLLQFRSIRLVKEKQNLFFYIKALSLFNIVIDGERLYEHVRKEKFVKSINFYYKIISGLLSSSSSSKYPLYIEKCFDKLRNEKKMINIDLHRMNKYYGSFKKMLFVNPKCKYLLSFQKILNVFPNCTHITFKKQDSDVNKYKLSTSFVTELMESLNNINNIKRSTLKTIKLCYFEYDNSMSSEQTMNLLSITEKSKWNIQIIEMKKDEYHDPGIDIIINSSNI
eukprot:491059_1